MSRLDRLSRRGVLTIVADDGTYDVRLTAPGPYGKHSASCTTDTADLYEHVRLGASSWHGEGPNLDELLDQCEAATRPRYRDIDDLRWAIGYRRDSRTHGPPLPDFLRFAGKRLEPTWRPGNDRWLRTSDHKYEYLDGYLRDLATERKLEAEQAERDARARIEYARRVLS